MAKKEIIIYMLWIVAANAAGDLKIYCRERHIAVWVLSIFLLGATLAMGWQLGGHLYNKERIE